MRVRIADGEWVDSNDQKMVIELTPLDRVNIVGLSPRIARYAVFPPDDESTKEERKEYRDAD